MRSQGQDGQLRDRLRPLRLRARRPPADRAGGGAGVHRPLPRALPGRRAVHDGRRRARPRSTATSARCSAAAARSPRSARATGRRASSASGSRSTRVIQGTAADIIKVAMVRCHDALRAAGLADPLHPADPRRAAVRGPDRGGRAGDRDRRAARWSAPPRWTRRSPSSRASARTGSTRSSGPRGRRRADRRRRRPGRPAGADQLSAGQEHRHVPGRVLLVRDRHDHPRGDRRALPRRVRPDRGGARPRAPVPDRRRARRASTSRASS